MLAVGIAAGLLLKEHVFMLLFVGFLLAMRAFLIVRVEKRLKEVEKRGGK